MKLFFQKPEPVVAKLPPPMCVWVNVCGAGSLWGLPPSRGRGAWGGRTVARGRGGPTTHPLCQKMGGPFCFRLGCHPETPVIEPCRKISVVKEAGCWNYLVGIAPRASWMED